MLFLLRVTGVFGNTKHGLPPKPSFSVFGGGGDQATSLSFGHVSDSFISITDRM